MCTLILTLFVCLVFFSIYHWYIAIKGKTSLEICWEDPRYTPSSSYSNNLEIVFGTSNIFYCLCPTISILKHRGDRWEVIWYFCLYKWWNQSLSAYHSYEDPYRDQQTRIFEATNCKNELNILIFIKMDLSLSYFFEDFLLCRVGCL